MKKLILLLLSSSLLLFGCNGATKEFDVQPARHRLAPRQALAWSSRAAIDALMRYGAWSGSHSGSIALFARDGVPIYSNAGGWKDIASGQPMTVDTPVRIASMTKAITAVAAMSLVEEGRLGLDDPVAQLLPEFAQLQVALRSGSNTRTLSRRHRSP